MKRIGGFWVYKNDPKDEMVSVRMDKLMEFFDIKRTGTCDWMFYPKEGREMQEIVIRDGVEIRNMDVENRLIKTAPKLLEACEAILEKMEGNDYTNDPEFMENLRKLIKEAKEE
jgi:hypothetical protein